MYCFISLIVHTWCAVYFLLSFSLQKAAAAELLRNLGLKRKEDPATPYLPSVQSPIQYIRHSIKGLLYSTYGTLLKGSA